MGTVLAAAAALLAGAPGAALADPPQVTITAAPPAFTGNPVAHLEFTAPGAVTVTCRLDGPDGLPGIPVTPCDSPQDLPLPGDGAYVFTVDAVNADGPGEASAPFTLDTHAPDAPALSAPAEGATVRGPDVAVSGTAEPGAALDVLDGATTVAHTTAATDGTWSATAQLADGAHSLTAVATDAAGNASAPSAAHSVTVDSAPPETTIDGGPPALTDRPSATFAIRSSEGGSTFACRLTGPGHAEDFAACEATAAYTGLGDGDYTFAARATDAVGNTDPTPATWAFTVHTPSTPAAPAPAPLPSPGPLPSPLVPIFHAAVVARPGLADVRVKPPGSARFTRLTADRALPLGTVIDTRRGRVQILSVPRREAKPQRASFDGGVFRVTQPGRTTVLTLVGSCRPAHGLTGEGRGAFAVRGRYSSATVRNARWVVRDSCAGTLTRALEGVVQVRDQVRRRTVLLRAGRHYLARPHR
jgi:Bacterial Ig-like domain